MKIKSNILWENILTKAFEDDLAQTSVNKEKKEDAYPLTWLGNHVRGF